MLKALDAKESRMNFSSFGIFPGTGSKGMSIGLGGADVRGSVVGFVLIDAAVLVQGIGYGNDLGRIWVSMHPCLLK